MCFMDKTELKVNSCLRNEYILLVYSIISLSGILLFLIFAPFKGVTILEWLNMENNSDWAMMDFFRVVIFDQRLEDVYSVHAIYPPLSVLFHHYFARVTSLTTTDYGLETAHSVTQLPYQMMVYAAYISAGISLLLFAISQLKTSSLNRFVLSISVLLSTPMMAGALERGNCVLFAFPFLFIAMSWKDSDSKLKRELALILIALSAGLKLYPAVFGVVYLKEKRFAESIRLIVYGIMTILFPFLFVGGIKAFELFVDTSLNRYSDIEFGRIQCVRGMLVTLLGKGFGHIDIFYWVIVVLLFALVFISKDRIRTMVYVSSIMAFVPTRAYRYTLLAFVLVAFVLFTEKEIKKVDGVVISALLASVFTIPILFGLLTGFEMNYGYYTLTYVEVAIYIPAWSLLCYCIVREVIDIIGRVKSKPQSLIRV